jgi:hypothetical protein
MEPLVALEVVLMFQERVELERVDKVTTVVTAQAGVQAEAEVVEVLPRWVLLTLPLQAVLAVLAQHPLLLAHL